MTSSSVASYPGFFSSDTCALEKKEGESLGTRLLKCVSVSNWTAVLYSTMSMIDMAGKSKRSIITKDLGAGVWILDRLGLFSCHPAKS